MKKTGLTLLATIVLLLITTFDSHGQGFSLSATNWTLPAGGESDDLNYGFRHIAYSSNSLTDLGSQSWNVMDMNGDSKPDLVVLAEKQASNVLVFILQLIPFESIFEYSNNTWCSSV